MAQYELNLRDYWLITRKRKWIILFTVLLVAGFTFFTTEVFGPTPTYEASARVKFDRSTSLSGLMTETLYGSSESSSLTTQAEVIPLDLQRFFQYGDRSQDIVLRDNDIVFVPRQRIGDWNAFLAKINSTMLLLLGTQTMSPEALSKFLQDNNIQPVQVPTITVR